ncbi:hypothetical protein JCM14036_22410 [Desulfotomaculum defluvii]
MKQGDAIHFVNEAFKHAKAIGATNEGVDLLTASQIQGVPTAGTEAAIQPITFPNNTIPLETMNSSFQKLICLLITEIWIMGS